jgi:multidrug efflux pump subunit AcrA (membrane-fusion protein)
MQYPHTPRPAATRRRRPLLAAACVTALLLVPASGCYRPPEPAAAGAAEEPAGPPKVAVVRPERKTVRRLIRRPGYNVEANQSTPLYAKISGYVRKWNFDIGARVREGEVLAELSVPEMDVEVQQKEAAVLQAKAEIQQARSGLLRARAEYDRAKSQSERLSRVGRTTGTVTEEVVDEARLNFQAAEAALAKAQADVGVAEARLHVAQKAHEYARTLLQYKEIRAPFNGVVTQRKVNVGDFVQPAAGRKGEALFVVDEVDKVRVFVNVPEREAVWVRGSTKEKKGSEAQVRSDALLGHECTGYVERTSGALDPASRTLRTEIDLENREGKLLPGMYVDVTIVAESPDVWSLPESAVVSEEDQSFCYRVENGRAVRTPLRVGMRGEGALAVVQWKEPGRAGRWQDFTGQEEVVKGDVTGLKDGDIVQVGAR